VLHSCAGAILAGVIIAGSGVPGAVIAFQTAWVFFLAPYGILAQPIHTTILPELVAESRDDDRTRFRASVRWALERMGLAVLPVAVALVGLSAPAMRVVASFVDGAGAESLLATALATLAIGLFPYSAFLLLARAYYALGDTRTPGLVAGVVAVAGLLALVVGSPLADGTAQVAVMGLAHTIAYTLGAMILVVGLGRRTEGSIAGGPVVVMIGVSGVVAVGLWVVARELLDADSGVSANLAGGGLLLLAGAAVLGGAYRLSGLRGRLTTRVPAAVP
jgi:putative peptidoglycan lipid II flippase